MADAEEMKHTCNIPADHPEFAHVKKVTENASDVSVQFHILFTCVFIIYSLVIFYVEFATRFLIKLDLTLFEEKFNTFHYMYVYSILIFLSV